MTGPEFVALCKDLREMGATVVVADGMRAEFSAVSGVASVNLDPAPTDPEAREQWLKKKRDELIFGSA